MGCAWRREGILVRLLFGIWIEATVHVICIHESDIKRNSMRVLDEVADAIQIARNRYPQLIVESTRLEDQFGGPVLSPQGVALG